MIRLKAKRRPGYVLATILVLMGVILFGVGGIITISTLESKIARSQQEGTRAYYVAETGVQDALWRLNNDATYNAALANGTLNATYTATNKPVTGQGFTVTLASTSAHYGTITVVGYSDNNTFRAQRQINTDVFQGPVVSPTGSKVIMVGGSLQVTNGASTLSISGGDFYAGGPISINSATVNVGTYKIMTPGSYTANGGASVTSGGINSSNNLPAAPLENIPGLDFTYYATHNNASYTPTAFKNAVSNGGSTINFPGPVTYISGDVSITNWAKNKTLNFTGLLVINGSFSGGSASTGMKINILDPGNSKSGFLVKTTYSNNTGTWVINGVLYASGSMQFLNSGSITVNGGLISGGALQMNTGAQFSVTYDSGRVGAVFGDGSPLTVGVQHWEEEY